MANGVRRARLGEETPHGFGIVDLARAQYLHGGRAPEPRMDGQVHLPHTAFTDKTSNLVVPNRRPNHDP